MLIALVLGLGFTAGALTTVAGMGGGVFLLLSLSVLWGPTAALATSSLALLVGNLHRTFLYRKSVDWQIARAFVIGALPGALLGAILAVAVPPLFVNVLMLLMTLVTILRALGKLELSPPRSAISPAGFVIGGLTGSAGGAAVLTAPLFLSAGLVGEAYVATTSISAVSMHVGRILGYGAGGLFDRQVLLYATLLAGAILVGNGAGKRLRKAAERLPEGLLEHLTLVACVMLAFIGVGR
jgi:uncharacterized membrane protein YfcA